MVARMTMTETTTKSSIIVKPTGERGIIMAGWQDGRMAGFD
jgi:hypothetical protein